MIKVCIKKLFYSPDQCNNLLKDYSVNIEDLIRARFIDLMFRAVIILCKNQPRHD